MDAALRHGGAPQHLIVVGSGVTGAEFASAYMNLGSKVTLISSRDQVLPGRTRMPRVLERVFKRGGMTVLSKSRADKVENTRRRRRRDARPTAAPSKEPLPHGGGLHPEHRRHRLEEAGSR